MRNAVKIPELWLTRQAIGCRIQSVNGDWIERLPNGRERTERCLLQHLVSVMLVC